jgi:hypothetical protein
MKRLFLCTTLCTLLFSCTDNKNDTELTANDSTDNKFAYTLDNPEWKQGSAENTRIAMAGLKAYETNNIAECITYMSDSIRFEFDGMEASMTRDSALTFLQQSRNMYKTLTVKMEDYESVKNDKSEFVSLWYKQIMETQDGIIDSLEVINDFKMKDGKITMINQKARKYGVKGNK